MKSLMLSTVFVLSLLLASPANAAQTFVVKADGTAANVFATTITTDINGCTVTQNTTIQTFSNAFRQLGQNQLEQASSIVLVYYSRSYNRSDCGLDYSFSNYNDNVTIPDGAFVVDKQLASASLNATVMVTDSNDAAFPVQITVDWTATSRQDHQHDVSINGSPKSIFHFQQKDQPAKATYSLNGHGVAVSGSTDDAAILRTMDGNIVIIH